MDGTIDAFWTQCRSAVAGLPHELPSAWAFGATPEVADDLVTLVLEGTKTATSSSAWEYNAAGEQLPRAGDLNIVLDGDDVPRALIETTHVRVVRFDEVTAQHTWAEGEGDRSLAFSRAAHENFWSEPSKDRHWFAPDTPVGCEEFRLAFSEASLRRVSLT